MLRPRSSGVGSDSSGLRRRVKAAVFGRGSNPTNISQFVSHLLYFPVKYRSLEINSPQTSHLPTPWYSYSIVDPSRGTISRTLPLQSRKAKRPLKNQTTLVFKSYSIIHSFETPRWRLTYPISFTQFTIFSFLIKIPKLLYQLNLKCISTCSLAPVPERNCAPTATLAPTITLFGLYEFYDSSGSIEQFRII